MDVRALKLNAANAKGLHDDLIQLEKELKGDSPDTARVKKLLSKIGPATTKLSDKCEDETVSAKVRSLGKALTQSAT